MPTTGSTSSPKRARARSPKKAPFAHLDDALFVPRLDQLDLGADALEGAGPGYSELMESICGVVDDSQEVEQYDGTLGVTAAFVAAHEQPVAQVAWNANLASTYTDPGNVSGVRWGSGTMIGPDLFLTCGHLFDADPNGWRIPRQNGTVTAITPQQAATSMHLNFLYQRDPSGAMRAEQSFPIVALVEYRLGGLDMALCRIGGSPGSTYGWTEFGTTNPAVGDMLAIIGHPAGQPKRIEAGPATGVTGTVVSYNDIDTLGGNSGSGILHAATGRVVGVHTNGGCNSAGTGSNTGVAIAAIVAASPTLRSLTPSSSTASAADRPFATRISDDVLATHAAADRIDTAFLRDHGGFTLATLDDVGTGLGRDTTLVSDQIGTPLARDVRGTVLSGDLTTKLAGDLGTVGAGDDPNNTLQEGVFDPGKVFDPVLDPVVRGGLAGFLGATVRPFVQAGEHADVGAPGDGTLADQVLAELDALLVAQQSVTASLTTLRAALAAMFEEEA
ncbi:hypothetical protein CLV28_1111 [Sediminihabitans luteus]|uniref:Serine protease n=1 Tax=Sediminihabitans luteus TaxID=1138585 RepID=A0A2M9D1C3_9CELL|nr:trypsin-like peptidase domain-containing protein [Sediminihabitans luteus]PJJ77885.1 hypothetical protein CLV28_1111 [Sediminihabitans luteus]GII99757.1 hypothetical protein Slu03_21350 [Sediminihabitans luteus]